MINLQISEKQAQYIIESLLFSSGCDVCSDWDKNDIDEMIETASLIRKQNNSIKIENIFVHNPLLSDNNEIFDSITTQILLKFPEILKEDI